MQATPIKNGVILGCILAICSLLMCLISKEAYLKFGSMVLFFVVFFFMIKIGRDAKAMNEGFLSFGEAFKSIFIGSAIAFLICTVFRYFLYNFIFPDLAEIMKDITLEMTNSVMDWAEDFGGDEVAVAMEDARDEIDAELTTEAMQMTVGKSMQELVTRLVFPGAIVSLIAALITKKNPPSIS